MVLELDKEIAAAVAQLGDMSKFPKPAVHDIEGRRQLLAGLVNPNADSANENVLEETILATAEDGHEVPVLRFKVKGGGSSDAPGPAVLHMHGGGYIALRASINNVGNRAYALESGVQVFSVDYRLAPEHPYPTGLEDCWAALQHIISNAKDLGVDVARIGVMGESAGGGLAAAMTLLARDRNLSPPLARQILVFPMLDDRNKEVVPEGMFSVWNHDDTLTGWTAYLGSKAGGPDVPATAAPARVSDVAGLPPLFLEVGQMDHFMKEDYAYVQKFIDAGIEVEFHVYPGMPHGWSIFGPGHRVTIASQASKINQLKRL
ncbi:hypothetical protein K4F52_002306 [Lecanicillium sp. MT-2017a]|nr:hypothetical protein K4F52_002306 [Lecanicillium sp. MT-2017a]